MHLSSNPLLKRPLVLADVKHMLLGHDAGTELYLRALLPILHLNGYKIANTTVLARITREEREQLLRGYGWAPVFVEGHQPEKMHDGRRGPPVPGRRQGRDPEA